jgi:hypothetical protein
MGKRNPVIESKAVCLRGSCSDDTCVSQDIRTYNQGSKLFESNNNCLNSSIQMLGKDVPGELITQLWLL